MVSLVTMLGLVAGYATPPAYVGADVAPESSATLIHATANMTKKQRRNMHRHRAEHLETYVSEHPDDSRFFSVNIAERCSIRAVLPKAPSQYRLLTHEQVREAWGGVGWGCNHACAHGDHKRDGVHGAWPEVECTGYTEQITSEETNDDGQLIQTGLCEFYFGTELAIFKGSEFDPARLPRATTGSSTCYVKGVDCGGHSAARCKFCPERTARGYMIRPEWQCNGQCMFKYKITQSTKHVQGTCSLKEAEDVNLTDCGAHSAHSCIDCVTRFTFVTAPKYKKLYCNGDCDYARGDCGVPAPTSTTANDDELVHVTEMLNPTDDDESTEGTDAVATAPRTATAPRPSAEGAIEEGVGFDVDMLRSRLR